jgi:hypothetical protein
MFKHGFILSAFDKPQPPGTYRLVTVDNEIDGLSFVAYRRTSTVLHLPALSSNAYRHQAYEVDRDELEAALRTDRQAELDEHQAINKA